MKRLLAIILAVVLLGTMAISTFAAGSPTATGTEGTQTAGNNIVATIEEDDIVDGKVDLTDEVAAEVDDTITLTGLPKDTPTEVSIKLKDPKPTIVLKDVNTGDIVLGKLDDDGTYKAIVNGDSQLDVVDNTPDYSDGPFVDWAKDAIDRISALELLIGYPDGAFHPDDTLTGAQVVTALSRLNANLGGEKLDTVGDNWYEAPLAWAASAGLTDGSDPFVPFTRQQLIDILAKFAGVSTDATEWVVTTGLVIGDGTGNLMEKDNLTRAQFATVLDRYVNTIIFG